MLITKTSLFSGKAHSREIPVTMEQINAWQSGTCIQVAMRHLTADDREFLMTGITPVEWAEWEARCEAEEEERIDGESKDE